MCKLIYEYFIDNGKLVKLSHDFSVTPSGLYKLKIGKSNTIKYLRYDEFDQIYNNRLFSFDDDMESVRDKFISHLQSRIAVHKEQLKQCEMKLNKLWEELDADAID